MKWAAVYTDREGHTYVERCDDEQDAMRSAKDAAERNHGPAFVMLATLEYQPRATPRVIE